MSSAAFVLLYIAHALRRQMAHAFADAGRRAPSGGRRWRGAATQGKKLSGHFLRRSALRAPVPCPAASRRWESAWTAAWASDELLFCPADGASRRPPCRREAQDLPASAKVWASLRPRCVRLPADPVGRRLLRARASVTGLGKQAGHEVDECSHLGCRLPVLRIDDRYRPPGTLVPVFEHRAQQA